MYKTIKALLLFLILSAPVWCQPSYPVNVWGYCEQGGVMGIVQYTTSNVLPEFMSSYPGCTITVYNTGTLTKASIVDASNNPSANPFTANAVTGYWNFHSPTGSAQVYDVQLSGAGIATPFTLGAYNVISSSGGTLTGTGTTGTPAAWTGPTSLGNATYQDIFSLFSGCSGTDYPGYDGACHPASSGGMFPTCALNDLLYYAATGNVPSCLVLGSGLSIAGGTLNVAPENFTYTAPGTGAVPVPFATQFTGTTIIAADYGVVADAVIESNGTVDNGSGGSPTDNCAAITYIMATLDTKGQQTVIFPAGGIATSCNFTLGNGTLTTWSTTSSLAIKGAGGYQGLVGAGKPASYPTGTLYLAQTGGTEFIYIGSDLGTTPVFTVQGPITDVTLDGFAVNCRYLAQTGIYLSSIEGSHIHDVFAIDNEPGTAIYNAGFWVDALSSGPIGYSGTQSNRFVQWGTLAQSLNIKRTQIMIGCGDVTLCPDTLDVSGNSFVDTIALDYAGTSWGIVLGYEDGNNFENQFLNAPTPWYILRLSNGFPGSSLVTGTGIIAADAAYMNAWTLTENITDTYGSGSVTFTTSNGIPSTIPLVGQFIANYSGAGQYETMKITNVVVNSPTTMTITAARGPAAGLFGQIILPHTSGTAIVGPYGYVIDTNASSCTTGSETLYFPSAQTPGGEPPNSRFDAMFNPDVCNVTGTTSAGLKFNSPGTNSTPANTFIASQYSYSDAISDTTSAVYFSSLDPSLAPTVSHNAIGPTAQGDSIGQGALIHVYGTIAYTNTSGGTINAYGAMNLTTNTASTAFLSSGYTAIVTATTALVDFDVRIKVSYVNQSDAYLANLEVHGSWNYSQSGGAITPYAISGVIANQDLTTGLKIDMGSFFGSASADTTAVLQDMSVEVKNPEFTGLFPH